MDLSFVIDISLGIMSSMFIHVVACVRTSFLFKIECYSAVWMDHILLIHSSIQGHQGCFHLLAVVNNAAVDMGVQTSVLAPAFGCFGCKPTQVSSTFRAWRQVSGAQR